MNMKLTRHLGAKAIVVALGLALTACGKSPEQHFQQAQELVKKADYKAAVIELKTVLQKQPDNPEARQLLGEVFIRNGAYLDAEKEITRARSLGAPDDQILPTLAKLYLKMGEAEKALELGTPSTNLNPHSLAAYHAHRAEAQLTLGKRAEAEQSIVAGKQADPNQPDLLLTEAKLSLIDKQTPQAEQLIDAALKADPKFTDALYLKAALLESEGKSDDAAKVYQKILANDPRQFRALLATANLELKKGNMEAADKAIQSAERVAGKAPIVKYARGILELRQGKLDKASNAFQDVLSVMPNHLPSMLAYATANYSLGHYEQSVNYAGKVLGALPNNLMAAKILAGSLIKTGDVNGGIKILLPLLPYYPNDAKLMALTGEAFLRAKDYNKAMGYLDRASELDPSNAVYRTRLAGGHLLEGKSDKALADLEQAVSLSDKPGQADLALIILLLKSKEYDKALQAIASLEMKLPNNPVTHNLRSAALLGKQDRIGARKELEQALTIDPKFFPAAVNLARLDMQDKKPEAARKRFDPFLQQEQAKVSAMLALADLAAAEKNEKDYVDWLEKAAKADPKAMQPRTLLVRHYLNNKETQKALNLARETANANPDSLQAMSLLGATQLTAGDKSNAIATFSRVTLRAPQSSEAYLRLALAQIADKQLAAGRDSLKTAIKLKPDLLEAQDALLQLELADKNTEAALQIARQIQIEQPNSPLGFDREADILLSQKQPAKASKAYERALSKTESPTEFVKLHHALYLSGDAKSAEQRLNSWLKLHPNDVIVRAYAAEYYMVARRDRDAILQYEEVVRLAPRNIVALNNLANLYHGAKDSRAQNVAEEAYKLSPDNSSVQDTLGWILTEKGQLPRAMELLGKAAAKQPKNGSIRYHYGVALARSGRKIEARKELEAAIASDQKFPELDDAKTLVKSL
jgi:putative PEP-CTERM system TPR-repeat lipoprotein